jgi:hypothetical protein
MGEAPDSQKGNGAIVVTRFECPNAWTLLILLIMHRRMKRDIRRAAPGFVGAKVVVTWSTRTMLNISLWDDTGSIHAMGRVPRHVDATRVPSKLGVRTAGAVYDFAGDWRTVMFDIECPNVSPLHSLT